MVLPKHVKNHKNRLQCEIGSAFCVVPIYRNGGPKVTRSYRLLYQHIKSMVLLTRKSTQNAPPGFDRQRIGAV